MNRTRLIHRNRLVAKANRRANVGTLIAVGFLTWLFHGYWNHPGDGDRWHVPHTKRVPGGKDR